MGIGLAILAGSALMAGASAHGSNKAAKEAKRTRRDQYAMYQQSREDSAPWREAGEKSLGTLQEMMAAGPGKFTESPGYRFRLGEGLKAINRGAAARGNWLNPSTVKSLGEYSQDYATGEYDNFLRRYYASLNPYSMVAGLGQNSATNIGNLGAQYSNQMANSSNAYTNAMVGGTMGAANAIGNGLSQYAMWQGMQPAGTGGNLNYLQNYTPSSPGAWA